MSDQKIAQWAEDSDTQLHTIRDLMLLAARRGAWLTLGEIAGLTEIGEASISAQLRHLRKQQHGRHRVEKRRRTRQAWYSFMPGTRGDAGRRAEGAAIVWEYRVLPPVGWEATVLSRSPEGAARRDGACSAGEIPSLVQSSGGEEATRMETVPSDAERRGAGDADSSGAPGR